ncbi:uncharacterized protein YjiS (DUF1127 family) [Caulobacter ginsengisoli]|uniref:Uncharacterized protein YjiS (DUF1127 family) n=1 Tax=Caulobacter ginsengisoli TaxID=400775 RepID=A0ABU0IP84_9CAUL|nr:hypothetical protein [Caulobacter ginsengisoli]MDQ0462782.1 uncharacterized protein YjiS (DUF1127 family) [Caulobacter ginsengisoli]
MIKWLTRLVRALTGPAPDKLAQSKLAKARKTLKTRLSPHILKDIGLGDP